MVQNPSFFDKHLCHGHYSLRSTLTLRVFLLFLFQFLVVLLCLGRGPRIFGRALLTPEGTLQEHPALRLGFIVAAVVWALLVRRELQKSRSERRASQAETSHIAVTAAPPPTE